MSAMVAKQSVKKCFTFTWKLENVSYCIQKKSEKIESPVFVVDEIHATRWQLWLYPRGGRHGNYVGFFLTRVKDNKDVIDCEIRYQLAFIAEDGSNLTSYGEIKHSFPGGGGGGGYGFLKFDRRDNVFISKRSTFLPGNILTACCRIWKSVGEMAEDVRCFARTRIGIEKRSTIWNLENFSTYETGGSSTYVIKSLEKNTKLISVVLSLDGGLNCDEFIRFKVTRHDQNIKFCVLHLSLVDVAGKRIEYNQDEFWFYKFHESKQFTFPLSRQKLMRKSDSYLPRDILSLYWEFVFSKGIVLQEIEEVQGGSRVPEANLFPPLNVETNWGHSLARLNAYFNTKNSSNT